MPKFRLAKPKSKLPPAPKAGLPCLILVLLGMALIMLFIYFAMRGAAPAQ